MRDRFFNSLTVDERAECLERGELRARAVGELLIEAGAPFSALTVLLSGSAEVRRGDGVVLAALTAGDIIGEISFLSGADGRATANVFASTPVDLVVLNEAELDSLIQDRPQTAARLYKSLALLLAQRLQAMSQSMAVARAPDAARSSLAPKRPWPNQKSP